jgi:putative oxidoreductase
MQWIYERFHGGRVGVALLLLRFITGLAFIFHGWPKVTDVAAFAGNTGLPAWLAGVAAYTELIGGILLILGCLTALAALFIGVEMLVAMFWVHIRAGHPFVASGGPSYELAALYLFIMLALLLTGPGAHSLDAWLMRRAEVAESEAPGAAPAIGRRRGVA